MIIYMPINAFYSFMSAREYFLAARQHRERQGCKSGMNISWQAHVGARSSCWF
jgi:hypothetical protein